MKMRKPRLPKYLNRLISTCLLLFLLPCILSLGLLVMHSNNQLTSANDNFFRETTASFMRYFDNELNAMKRAATQLNVDSRKSEKAISALNFDSEGNRYFRWQAASALSDYVASTDFMFSLYYAESNLILYHTNCYNSPAAFYANQIASGTGHSLTTAPEDFLDFFDMGSYSVRFWSNGERMLIGIPTQVGLSRKNAMAVFILDNFWADAAHFTSASASGAEYRVYDADGRLMTRTGTDLDLPELKNDQLPQNGQTCQLTIDKKSYTLFSQVDAARRLTFVSIVPFDRVTESMHAFFFTMKLTFGLEILVLALLGVGMVYVNYLPIHKLAQRLPAQHDDDELSGISDYINRLHSDYSEQKILLMDCLMNNLVSGTSVPREILTRVGLPGEVRRSFVMVLFERSVSTIDRDSLSGLLVERYGAVTLITDILGSDRMVIICLLENDNADSVAEAAKSWLTTRVAFPIKLAVGPVVESLNDINQSYAACIAPDDTAETELKAENQITSLRDSVLSYIESAFTDPNLSQVCVADRFGISVYSLSRLFKNHVGIGFSEYITSKRLDRAKTLLLTTNMSVNEVAQDVGIPNANYFSRLFKTNVGLSPMKYRSAEKDDLKMNGDDSE